MSLFFREQFICENTIAIQHANLLGRLTNKSYRLQNMALYQV